MVMSYKIKSIKPEPGIYHYLIDTYQIDPKQSLFIDDLPQNVEGAQRVGLQAIQFHSSAKLEDDLKNLGLL
jgi:putative hydrolase of the HAD superfamily